MKIYIRDDLGYRWYYKNGRIRMVGDKTKHGGYYCSSFQEGIELLNTYGYITGKERITEKDVCACKG